MPEGSGVSLPRPPLSARAMMAVGEKGGEGMGVTGGERQKEGEKQKQGSWWKTQVGKLR